MNAAQSAARSPAAALTRRGLLARNVVWNLAGVILPLLAALVAVPVLTATLGDARFGLLSLSWIFIGYFTIFDFGLGLALTKLVSARIAEARQASLPALIGTAFIFAGGLAIASGCAVWQLAPWLIGSVMKIPADLHREALGVLRVLAVSIPFVILGTVVRGVLEALQRFDIVNIVRVASGLYLFLGPLLFLPYTHDMAVLIGALAAGKIASTLVFAAVCWQQLPDVRRQLRWETPELQQLFRFGGWITLGNILGPLLSYTDHFMIGALVSLQLVGYYVVPYQMVTKLWPVIAAVVAVLFPALSIQLLHDRSRARTLFLVGMKAVVVLIAPAALLLTAFAGDLLGLWLGAGHARIGGPLLQIFSIGVLVNSFSFVTLALVQAAGRPDWVPKLFMVEMPLYLAGLYLAISGGGLQGAALIWLAKIVVDFLFLLWASARVLPEAAADLRRATPGFALLFVSFLPFLLPLGLLPRAALAAVWLLAWVLLVWLRVLGREERLQLRRRLRAAPAAG
ncbi:MAG TPA: flippase [Solimonas sp.]|nr:flippase [Solimonas sp.]